MFPHGFTPGQVAGMDALLDALDAAKVSDRCYAAYIFATAYHETAFTMQPVRETLASTDAKAVAILDAAFAKGQLSWVKTPYWRFDADGKTWLGRGFVQLTHKANYQKAKDKTGIDFVGNPSLAMDAEAAAVVIVRGMIEGWFTGKALKDYIGAKADYINARRIINGVDKAATIAGYAGLFEKALRIAWAAEPAPTTTPAAPAPALAAAPTLVAAPAAAAPSTGFAALLAALLKIMGMSR